MITAIVMPVVLYFSLNENGGAGDGTGWFAFALIGGGIATLGAVISASGQRRRPPPCVRTRRRRRFKDVFSVLLKNDQLLWIAIAYLVFVLGQNVIQ